MTDTHGHSRGFLDIVGDAKSRIPEMTVEEYHRRIAAGEPLVMVDVREDREWDAGRLPGAVHLSKGIIERDVEKRFPDKQTPLVLQCGGGYRSALAADNLQKMGYRNVWSLAGGYRAWIAAGHPIEKG